MQYVYTDTRELDRAALKRFHLTDDILMENAAAALERAVVDALQKLPNRSGTCRVLVIAGGGDNGGDGWALARRLNGAVIGTLLCSVTVLEVFPPKSEACRRQAERALAAGVKRVTDFSAGADGTAGCSAFFTNFDLIAECLFGSGFHGEPDAGTRALIDAVNKADCFKIACDVPGGVNAKGCGTTAFRADATVCMGALKTAFFGDFAKNHTGKIVCADLGVSSALFRNIPESETETGHSDGTFFESAICTPTAFLLEQSDLRLPVRNIASVHKGCFGHAAVYTGPKTGAGIIAARAAFCCGTGLVSLVRDVTQPLYRSGTETEADFGMYGAAPAYLMQADSLPEKTTVVTAGPGFGRERENRAAEVFSLLLRRKELFCVFDADMFYYGGITQVLEKRPCGLVLTPHPKEFQSLLSLCGMGSFSVDEIVENRMDLVKSFCSRYAGAVLLLKGAHMIIGHKKSEKTEEPRLYINSFGMPCLAKGGSGDVLSGFITAFLAQKYSPLDAAIQGSLVLAASSRLQTSSYASTPFTLIQSAENPHELKKALAEDFCPPA